MQWSFKKLFVVLFKGSRSMHVYCIWFSSSVDMDPNAKKCRARHGMEQQALWCQPCR